MYKTEYVKTVIPTYEAGEPEKLPVFFEKRQNQGASARIYPMPYTDRISDEKKDKEYDAVLLENDYIKVIALPEIGGKIHSAVDKTCGYEFVYSNKVIKPAMIGIAGPWVSGGIEFNWPLHHRPTTFNRVDSKIVKNEDGTKTVWMGELEPYFRMKGMVGITVMPDRSYIKADVRLYNATAASHPFLWWANLAVRINDDYDVVFPTDVEYVNDHDRRAVLGWPIAKGRYETGRPYDYGEGTDIHHHRNIVTPSSFMISKGQCDADFVSGYDSARKMGTVTVANHYISPGKKLFTWGNGDFGRKWCSNLTDDGSRYVELMTGVYADNQPDFTYIAPYETKHFEQYWYPVRDIGEVKNATVDAAVSLEKDGDGLLLGFYATGRFDGCRILLTRDGENVYEARADLSPEKTFVSHVDAAYGAGLRAELFDAKGRLLVGYTVEASKNRKPIAPRKASPRPKDIATVEELWLHGKHLMQYKHFAYDPEEYFKEGLRRDPGDARCNESMGDLMMERCLYKEALFYYDAAEKRLELRNANPEDTDVLYKRGLCKRALGLLDDAYQDLYWSTWSYKNRSAGYYALAELAGKRNDRDEAVRLLKLSLETDSRNLWAKRMLYELTGDEGYLKEITEADPLFDAFRDTPAQALDLAVRLMYFGMDDRAIKVLEAADESVMNDYYLSCLYAAAEDDVKAADRLKRAEKAAWEGVNPNRAEDVPVLQKIGTPRASYYLGCLYYDRFRYADAAKAWEACVAGEEFAPAYRGLALAYFDHLDRRDEAREALEHAFNLAPDMPRLFYELTQMYKSINLSLDERLAFFESHRDIAALRDDCTLEYSQLLMAAGRLKEAESVLNEHKFHTYEGGEGNLTTHHAWLHRMMGDKKAEEGDFDGAFKTYAAGLTFPENYGEEKSFYVNDAPLYLGMSRCARALGREDKWLKCACHTEGGVGIQTYWQIFALRESGREDEARELTDEMKSEADRLYADRDLPSYFGVGAHAFMPFSYDIPKYNTMQSLQFRAFAALAEGKTDEAAALADEIQKIDCACTAYVMLRHELVSS